MKGLFKTAFAKGPGSKKKTLLDSKIVSTLTTAEI